MNKINFYQVKFTNTVAKINPNIELPSIYPKNVNINSLKKDPKKPTKKNPFTS